MFLISKTGKRKAICRECARLHSAKDCPKALLVPLLTMREVKLQRRLEEQHGRSLSWHEIREISGKYPKFFRVVNGSMSREAV